MNKRILVLTAGGGTSNNLVRSLKHADKGLTLLGCSSDRFFLHLSPAEKRYLVPSLERGDDAALSHFDAALRALVANARVDLILPGSDADVMLLATLSERRAFDCHICLPARATIESCEDKFFLNQILIKNSVAVPRTYAVSDKKSLFDAWEALAPKCLAWCRLRRGFASRGATKVSSAQQAWDWISYWHTMRDVAVEDFTLSEFLPGRDYNVQGLWNNGRLMLMKMCERLSYLNAGHNPSGMASTPALAKTVWEPEAIKVCEAALLAVDPRAHGVFNFDLKENGAGVPCLTEINAGRFAMISNLYNLSGCHNMASAFLRMAFGDPVKIDNPYGDGIGYYLIRELDSEPLILSEEQLFAGIEPVRN